MTRVQSGTPGQRPEGSAHFFTVDVEEHFQVSAFDGVVRREDWLSLESRVSRNVGVLLDVLERHGVRGTFFTLGWIAQHRPEVVREIANAGHEVASHGFGHQRVVQLTPDAFRDDVRRAKRQLEDVVGAEVLGYRAPSFSIVPGGEWAFDVLIEEGYRYDSSLFPVRRSRSYGYPGAPQRPHWIARSAGRLLELPLTTLRRFGQNVPAAGGAYLRLFPYGLVRSAFRAATEEGRRGVFYVHPWELDPEQPLIPSSWVTRLRHRTGLGRTVRRVERLLTEFPFTSIGTDLARLGAQAAA